MRVALEKTRVALEKTRVAPKTEGRQSTPLIPRLFFPHGRPHFSRNFPAIFRVSPVALPL